MNLWIIGGIITAFIAWSGFMYYEGSSREADACTKTTDKKELKQAGATITAQSAVIATIGKQQEVSQGVDHDYQLKKDDIDYTYAHVSERLQPGPIPNPRPTISLPAAGVTASRPAAATQRPFLTKVYKLTAKECDANTAQLLSLQAWVIRQLAIKTPAK